MDNITVYIPVIIMFVVITLVISIQKRNFRIVRKIQNKRMKANGMKDFITSYIGKDCIIYTINTQHEGKIKDVSERAVLIDTASGPEVINLDYIIRLREHPKNKKGKNKAIVID